MNRKANREVIILSSLVAAIFIGVTTYIWLRPAEEVCFSESTCFDSHASIFVVAGAQSLLVMVFLGFAYMAWILCSQIIRAGYLLALTGSLMLIGDFFSLLNDLSGGSVADYYREHRYIPILYGLLAFLGVAMIGFNIWLRKEKA